MLRGADDSTSSKSESTGVEGWREMEWRGGGIEGWRGGGVEGWGEMEWRGGGVEGWRGGERWRGRRDGV